MPPGESHVSRISKEYNVNYLNSSHRELGPPVLRLKSSSKYYESRTQAACEKLHFDQRFMQSNHFIATAL